MNYLSSPIVSRIVLSPSFVDWPNPQKLIIIPLALMYNYDFNSEEKAVVWSMGRLIGFDWLICQSSSEAGGGRRP